MPLLVPQEYASNALRGVRNMVELLQLATYGVSARQPCLRDGTVPTRRTHCAEVCSSFADCPPLPLDLAASGLPTTGVGVGYSIMYAERSNGT